MENSQKFAGMLTEAIYRIRACNNNKPIGIIQDEIGYELEKQGRSAIEYWRRGNIPGQKDLEELTKEIIKQCDLDRSWIEQFLTVADYPYPKAFCEEHFFNPAMMGLSEQSLYKLPPKPYRTFIGRVEVLGQALSAMRDPEDHWVVAIDGVGGMGKTALAYEIANTCTQKGLFDDVLWINVAEYADHQGRGLFTFESVLDAIGLYFRLPGFQQLTFAEKQRRSKQFLDQEERLLLVLDSLHTAAEPQNSVAEQLLSVLSRSKALLTSRHRFTGDIYPLHLDGLDEENAQRLIQQEAKNRKVNYIETSSISELQPLITMTGGSPLAMKLVVGQMGYLSLPIILERLQTAHTLGYGQGGDEQISLYQSIYAPSWQELSDTGKQLLIGMTLFIADIGGTVDEMQAICGFSQDEVTSAVEELWKLSLVEVSKPSGNDWFQLQYALHALTQYFVLSEIVNLNRPVQPMSSEYALFVENLERGLAYMETQIQAHASSLPPSGDRTLTLHMLNYALQVDRLWTIASQVLLLLAPKMEQAGYREDEWKSYLERSIAHSQTMKDAKTEAELFFHLGILQQQRGQYDAAYIAFSSTVHRFEQTGHTQWKAQAMIRKAQVCRLQNQYDEANELITAALALLEEDDIEYARGYYARGYIAYERQEGKEAVILFQKALALWKKFGDQRMTAWGLTHLGAAYRALGKYKEAIRYLTKAIVLQDEMQDPTHSAVTRMNLGNVYLDREDKEKALEIYLLAEQVFLKMKDELRLALVNNNKGTVYQKMAEWDKAIDAFTESVRLYRQLGKKNSLANALDGLGLARVGKQQYIEAITAYQEALDLLEEIFDEPEESKFYQRIQKHLDDALDNLI